MQLTCRLNLPKSAILVLTAFLLSASLAGSARSDEFQLTAVFRDQGATQQLESWNLKQLSHTLQKSSSEKDPESGKLTRWHGPLLNPLIEQALKQIPLEKRAQVDLVILRGTNGRRAVIPRSFVTEFPIVLATSVNHKSLGGRGPVFSVVPWTSKSSSVKQQYLPVESYFVPGLSTIVLTNAQDQFPFAFLRQRTDPIAMRGEKRFVQSCVACHSLNQKPSILDLANLDQVGKARALASSAHPKLPGGPTIPQLSEHERRSIQVYLDAFRAESTPAAAATAPSTGVTAK